MSPIEMQVVRAALTLLIAENSKGLFLSPDQRRAADTALAKVSSRIQSHEQRKRRWKEQRDGQQNDTASVLDVPTK